MVRKEIKKQIIERLDDKELVHFVFTQKEAKTLLNWEHSKEFEFNGEMYDVVKVRITGDTIHYWCWQDNEETVLNRKLKKLVNEFLNTDPAAKSKKQQVENFLKNLYVHTVSCWHSPEVGRCMDLSGYLNLYKPESVQPLIPPPKKRDCRRVI